MRDFEACLNRTPGGTPCQDEGATSSSPHCGLAFRRPAKAMSSHLMRGCVSPRKGVSKSGIGVTSSTVSRFPTTDVYHRAAQTFFFFAFSITKLMDFDSWIWRFEIQKKRF
ncbi:MAG: hypothetical protein ACK5V0_02170 [Alphaproteobacteria bacterium]